ncbi:hypothetical protein [Maliponia aquimaris]|uniref:DUF1254 domain-containing protein n=1 Tax=Maliponia aquimaris TaxID=1673631 RepID=A0A238K6F5_9RHOB|nr:hypothetical protein [Maliponia aquimaris]SMX38395.1 hypothetical protein MAA8898_01573 [Maliponia aquimaris]
MYLLAGFFGLMALASVTLAGFSVLPEDAPPDDEDDDPGPFPMRGEGDTLFARMGLVDMPWPEPLAAPAVPQGAVSCAPGGAADPSPWLDYDADEEHLVVIYDDTGQGEDPQLALVPRADDPAITEIVVGGRVLASLPTAGAPPLSAIFLLGESAAAALASPGFIA